MNCGMCGEGSVGIIVSAAHTCAYMQSCVGGAYCIMSEPLVCGRGQVCG